MNDIGRSQRVAAGGGGEGGEARRQRPGWVVSVVKM